jgi:hypothetical protein
MKAVLVKKYGEPTQDFAFFQRPYFEGDGYEEQAIRLGKGHFSCYWTPPKDSKVRGDTLALNLTERLTVKITYESSNWGEEAERRNANRTKIF